MVDLVKNKKFSIMPVTQIPSGLIVGNFSSPHTFLFNVKDDEGNQWSLPRCSVDRVNALSMNNRETVYESVTQTGVIYHNVSLHPDMGEVVREELSRVIHIWKMRLEVDVVLVPLMLLDQIRKIIPNHNHHPFRAIRRIERGSFLIHHDRFCV